MTIEYPITMNRIALDFDGTRLLVPAEGQTLRITGMKDELLIESVGHDTLFLDEAEMVRAGNPGEKCKKCGLLKDVGCICKYTKKPEK